MKTSHGNKLDNQEIPRLATVFSDDTLNVGDENSNPIHYFYLGRNVVTTDWPTIRKEFVARSLVLGGGYLSNMLSKGAPYFRLADEVEKLFVWGIGVDPDITPHQPTLDRCTLVGIREHRHKLIDNRKVFYAPCVSCMSPLFDLDWPVEKEVVFFRHSHHSKILDKVGIDASATMKNRLDFISTLKFIASGETVVTNSYHGAYYATLLGRKVVAIVDEGQWDNFRAEKFKCFKFPPVLCSSDNWREEAKRAVSYPESLEDSRNASISFYEKVLQEMAEVSV